jgi:hypothetical protein
MDTNETKEMVRNWYGSVAAGNAGCCGSNATPRDASCGMGYSEAELASLPEGADLGLGCGNPPKLDEYNATGGQTGRVVRGRWFDPVGKSPCASKPVGARRRPREDTGRDARSGQVCQTGPRLGALE